MPRWTTRLSILAAVSNAGVCEELEIPMDTMVLPDGMGTICIVRQCSSNQPAYDGRVGCVQCGGGEVGSEFCPTELGKCDNGKCVPRTDSNYFKDNFGRPWTGLNTFPRVTATHYGGSTAGGGYGEVVTVDGLEDCFKRIGIDGVVAVPPQMYGPNSFNGIGLFKRNNLCYKLTGVEGIERIVAVFDRCGGYTQCKAPPGGGDMVDIRDVFEFPPIDVAPGAVYWSDANQCISRKAEIVSGLGHECSLLADGDYSAKGCCGSADAPCGSNPAQQVDWCGSNSHPHFDMSPAALDMLCDQGRGGGIAKGSCKLKKVEAIKCPLWPRPPKCCDKGSSCDTCVSKGGDCNQSEQACNSCGGKYCLVDDWWDICHADTPSPKPTPAPTKAPDNGGGDDGHDDHDDGHDDHDDHHDDGHDDHDDGHDDGHPDQSSTEKAASKEKKKSNTPAIMGAAAGVAAVMALAGVGAKRLRPAPVIDADFEQQDDVMEQDVGEREGIVQQMSEDFA